MPEANAKNLTIAAYDQYHRVYDAEVADFWRTFPSATVDAFCAHLPGKKILDVGSGSGRDAAILRSRGLEVVCLYASAKMIAMTQAMGLESRLAEFSDMQLPDQSFDGAWAYTSLIHVPPPEATQAIREIGRALKPQGVFLIGVIIGEKAGMVERRTMPGVQRYFKQYTRAEITQLVSSQGFKLQYEEIYRPHNTVYLSQVYRLAEAADTKSPYKAYAKM